MTRPEIIRADTLDLQDKTSPTAKDHSRQPHHPAPLGVGPPAPHQEASLRHVTDERNSEEAHLQNGSALRNSGDSSNGNSNSNTQDEQAVRLNGGVTGDDHAHDDDRDDDDDDGDMQDADVEDDMDDDMMDKISSSPSIDDEDIDFEFVYALHTFVATVEGQANATKGDTMVLLDDTNSYWWLVRVVKDNSIGYLPAEHIETPTERLARLNKHRNIDLSQTMLGDTTEKSKNPLKKAIRRRNGKTVEFAPPTYVEASDYEYSSDEDADGEPFGGPDPTKNGDQNQNQAQASVQAQASAEAEPAQDDGITVQPLKVNGAKPEVKNGAASEAEVRETSGDAGKSAEDKLRSSDDSSERPLDPKFSRNGTLRNTDSFFKDETTETRKITLTPNLLRDSSSGSTTSSARERGPSLESLEKNGFADKVKDDKKKKEKKPGMLSGLFKRKEKRPKDSSIDLDSENGKVSEESGRSSPNGKASSEFSSARGSSEQAQAAPQRNHSKGKLQKSLHRREESPIKNTITTEVSSGTTSASYKDNSATVTPLNSTLRTVPESSGSARPSIEAAGRRSNSKENEIVPASVKSDSKDTSTRPSMETTTTLRPAPATTPKIQTNDGPVRAEPIKKASQRMQLDDFDSEDDTDPFADPGAENKPAQSASSEPAGRHLTESPVEVTSSEQTSEKTPTRQQQDSEYEIDPRHPPGLTADASSLETNSLVSTPTLDDNTLSAAPQQNKPNTSAPRSGPSTAGPSLSIPPPARPAPVPETETAAPQSQAQSQPQSQPQSPHSPSHPPSQQQLHPQSQLQPTLHIHPQPHTHASSQPTSPSDPTPPLSAESTTLPAWSDAALRSYLEDGTDIRDMLVVINDTTGVVPAGPEHPFMAGLFVAETEKVRGLSGELDGLLNGWLERRAGRRRGVGAGKVVAF